MYFWKKSINSLCDIDKSLLNEFKSESELNCSFLEGQFITSVMEKLRQLKERLLDETFTDQYTSYIDCQID